MGEVVIITGGGRGIGAATARLAATRGWDVCASFRADRPAAERVVAECRSAGARAIAVRADVAVEQDVLDLFTVAERELGPVRALVNNAGIVAAQTRVEELDIARVERVFAVNVLGAFLCAREAVRRMSTARGGTGGVIVNVSSRAAVLGAAGEYVDYAAAKAAVDTMTIGLAKEVADAGIRVNAVRPGVIDTEIHASGGEPGRAHRVGPTVPMGRAGRAEEVAEAILWLMSPAASFTTGGFLDVSGGR